MKRIFNAVREVADPTVNTQGRELTILLLIIFGVIVGACMYDPESNVSKVVGWGEGGDSAPSPYAVGPSGLVTDKSQPTPVISNDGGRFPESLDDCDQAWGNKGWNETYEAMCHDMAASEPTSTPDPWVVAAATSQAIVRSTAVADWRQWTLDAIDACNGALQANVLPTEQQEFKDRYCNPEALSNIEGLGIRVWYDSYSRKLLVEDTQ